MKRLLATTALAVALVPVTALSQQPYFRMTKSAPAWNDPGIVITPPDTASTNAPSEMGLRYATTQATIGYPLTATPILRNPPAGTVEYAIVRGGLPDTLAFDTATGIISGIPKAEGSVEIAIQAKAKDGDKYIAVPVTLTFLPAANVGAALPVATAGGANVTAAAYDAAYGTSTGATSSLLFTFERFLAADGFTLAGVSGAWSLEAQSATGAWTSLYASNGSGSYSFAPFTARLFRLNGTNLNPTLAKILSGGSAPTVLSVNQLADQRPNINADVDLTLLTSDASGPVTWSAAGLPPGLRLDADGVIRGAPTQVGSYAARITATDANVTAVPMTVNFHVQATDLASALFPASASKALVATYYDSDVSAASTASLAANEALVLTFDRPVRADSIVADGTSANLDVAYRNEATGAFVSVGKLLTATGSTAFPAQSSAAWRITNAGTSAASVRTLRVATGSAAPVAPSIVQAAALQPEINIAFSKPVASADVVGTPTWTVTSGAFQPTMTLDPNGTMRGTPTAVADATATVTVRDPRGVTSVPKAVTVSVQSEKTAADLLPVTMSGSADLVSAYYDNDATSTANATSVLIDYGRPIKASGSGYTGNRTASSGTVYYKNASGNFVTAGTLGSTFAQVTASVFRVDFSSTSTTQSMWMTFGGSHPYAPQVYAPAIQYPTVNATSTLQLSAGEVTGTAAYALAQGSALPPGVQLAPNGLVTMSPTAVADYAFNVTVTDDRGIVSQPRAVSIRVQSDVLASSMLPTTVNGTTGNVAALFDEDAAVESQLNDARGATYTYTYPRAVKVDSVYQYANAFSVYPGQVSYLSSTGSWVLMGQTNGTASPSRATLTNPGSSTQFQIALSSSASSSQISTMRLGNGAAFPIAPSVNPEAVRNPSLNALQSWKLTASNVTGTAQFRVASGALPSNMTLALDGTLSGTPDKVGEYAFAVNVTDDRGLTSIGRPMTVKVQSDVTAGNLLPLTINGSAATVARLYDADSGTDSRDSGSGRVTWVYDYGKVVKVDSFFFDGTLGGASYSVDYKDPSGSWVNLSQNLYGTTSNFTPGTSQYFQVTFGGTYHSTVANALKLGTAGVFPSAPQVTVPATITPTVNVASTTKLAAPGVVGTAVFSIVSGALPPGTMQLLPDGTLTGTPTAVGDYTINVSVKDDRNIASVTKAIAISVQSDVDAGTVLPSAMTVNGIGILAQAYDADSAAESTYSGSGAYEVIATFAQPVRADRILSSGTLFDSYAGSAWYQALPSNTWVQLGQTLNGSGTSTFTPASAKSFKFVPSSNKGSWTLSTLKVGGASNTYLTLPSVTAEAPRTPAAGVLTSWQLKSTAVVGTAQYRVVSGALPSGMGLTLDGVLSGTPDTIADYAFAVSVTDDRGIASPAKPMTVSVQSNVDAGTVLPATMTINGTNVLALSYDNDLAAESTYNGSGAYETIVTFAQPVKADRVQVSGTSFSNYYGAVYYQSLTTNAWVQIQQFAGSSTFTSTSAKAFKFTPNSANGNWTQSTLKIGGASNTYLTLPSVTAEAVRTPSAGVLTSWQLKSTAVTGTAQYRVVSGALPSGMGLSLDGVLSGTPDTITDYTFAVSVTDDRGIASVGRPMTVSVQSNVDAGTVLPATMTINGTNVLSLSYDNDTAAESTYNGSGSYETIVTFSQPVKADRVTVSGTSFSNYNGWIYYQSLSTNAWMPIQQFSGSTTFNPASAKAFKFVPSSANSNWTQSTLKVGGASNTYLTLPSVTAEAIRTPAANAFASWQLKSTAVVGTPQYRVVSGALPPGMGLTLDGLLSGTPDTITDYTFSVSVTDDRGIASVGRPMTVSVQSNVDAGTVLPATLTIGGSNALALAYDNDGSAESAFSGYGNYEIVVTYAQPVKADRFVISSSAFNTYYGQLKYLNPATNQWVDLQSVGGGTNNSFSPTTAKSFKIVPSSSSSSWTLDMLKFGGASNAYPTLLSVNADAGRSATVGTDTSWQYTAKAASGATTFRKGTGTLPLGMNLTTDGVLAGNPTTPGDYAFTIVARDDRGVDSVAKPMTVRIQSNVNASDVLPISIEGSATLVGALYDNESTADSSYSIGSGGSITVTYAQSVKVDSWTGSGGAINNYYGQGTLSYRDANGNFQQIGTTGGSGLIAASSTQFRFTASSQNYGPVYTLKFGTGGVYPTAPRLAYDTVRRTPIAGQFASWKYLSPDAVGTPVFRKVAGAYPTGMDMAADGTLSGTPTTPGTYNFAIALRDDSGASSTAKTMTVDVQSAVAASDVLPSSINGVATLIGPLTDADQSGESSTYANGNTEYVFTYPQPVRVDSIQSLGPQNSNYYGYAQVYAYINGAWTSIGNVGSGSNSLTLTTASQFKVGSNGNPGNTYTLRLGTGGAYQTMVGVNAGTQTIRVGQAPAALTANNQQGGATFARTSGTLPGGLTFNADGSFSGTATATGTFNGAYTVKDDRGIASAGRTVTIVVNP